MGASRSEIALIQRKFACSTKLVDAGDSLAQTSVMDLPVKTVDLSRSE